MNLVCFLIFGWTATRPSSSQSRETYERPDITPVATSGSLPVTSSAPDSLPVGKSLHFPEICLGDYEYNM